MVIIVKDSTFDGDNRYTILVTSTDKKKSQVISFDPQTETITSIQIIGITPEEVGKTLHIIVDGIVKGQTIPVNPATLLFHNLIHLKNVNNTLTILDTARLYLFAKSIPGNKITLHTYTFPKDRLRAETESANEFIDIKMGNERLTISIINASGISGIGSRLEKVLVNAGINIISVTTSPEDIAVSKISYREGSHTVNRLISYLNYQSQKTKDTAVSDIIIVIGKDSSNTKKF